MTRGTEHGSLRRRLVGATVVVSVLAGTLGAGSAVAQNGSEATPQARPQTQAPPQPQPQPQPRMAGSDEEYANLYTHTVGNIRSAMLGDEAVQQPGSGRLIRNPDPEAFQSVNIGRLAERNDIEGRQVRGLFRRSDNYLLGFYVRRADGRQIVYTFTEGGRDMVPDDVYEEAQRSRLPFPVTYRDLPTIQVGRGLLRDAVRQLFDNDPGTSNHRLQDGVERLAVALAEGSRFQLIPGLIAQHIRGGQDWTVGDHEAEIHDWSDRSEVVMDARAADLSGGNRAVWGQQRPYRWNGANVMLTALDLARRLYLIKPPPKR
ncbi:ribosome-inactivating family protein [Streptomyces sioyaensis]|uniref:ribosome-inactivating family protein n=1 Tax=Streptomyces sioyaensis TaxID=67364 RepID=UPI003D756F72